MPRTLFALCMLTAGIACGGPGDEPAETDAGTSPSQAAESPPPPPPMEAETGAMVGLTDTSWRLHTLDDVPVPDGAVVTLAFDDEGAVNGSGGCNRFSGSVQRVGHVLTFGPLASTRMACEGVLMELEAAFFALLGTGVRYEWTADDDLWLYTADGEASARFVPLAGIDGSR